MKKVRFRNPTLTILNMKKIYKIWKMKKNNLDLKLCFHDSVWPLKNPPLRGIAFRTRNARKRGYLSNLKISIFICLGPLPNRCWKNWTPKYWFWLSFIGWNVILWPRSRNLEYKITLFLIVSRSKRNPLDGEGGGVTTGFISDSKIFIRRDNQHEKTVTGHCSISSGSKNNLVFECFSV